LRIKSSETSGITILLIGLALLLVTFTIGSIHLHGEINVLPVPSLMASLGEALSPLLEATIRIIYLAVMGWIAFTVTAKGITMLYQSKLPAKNSLYSEE
jgi:hypothetical protein